MSDSRRKDVQWNLGDGTTWDTVKSATLMDIRDELKKLNALLYCQNFIAIPRKLDAIEFNTRKPRKKRKKK